MSNKPYLLPSRGAGNDGYSQLITPFLWHFSHSSPAPSWAPHNKRQFSMNFSKMSLSYGLQLFMSCSSMSPFHRVQSFRNSLLQHGSSAGSQVLPSNPLQCGLLSPWILPGSCSSMDFPRGHTPSYRHIHLLWLGVFYGLQVHICSTLNLHGLQRCSLSHHGLHCRLQGNFWFGVWSTSPSFFTDVGTCRGVSLS